MRAVKNKVFIDTNVLIYAYDLSAGDKHAIAKEIVLDIWNERRGVLSTQVLQEFTVAVTSKIARPINFELGCPDRSGREKRRRRDLADGGSLRRQSD